MDAWRVERSGTSLRAEMGFAALNPILLAHAKSNGFNRCCTVRRRLMCILLRKSHFRAPEAAPSDDTSSSGDRLYRL